MLTMSDMAGMPKGIAESPRGVFQGRLEIVMPAVHSGTSAALSFLLLAQLQS